MKKSNTFQNCWPFQNTSDVLQLLSICSVCQPVSNIQHTSVAGFIWCILLLLVWKPLASLAHLHPDKNKVDCVFCTSSLPPPNTTQIHFSPSLALFLTHRACLLVQEDVCSAHFNMNIIIFYLAAIRFLVINQHEPAVFIPEHCETKIIFIFPLKVRCHYVKKKEEKNGGVLQHLFLMAMK